MTIQDLRNATKFSCGNESLAYVTLFFSFITHVRSRYSLMQGGRCILDNGRRVANRHTVWHIPNPYLLLTLYSPVVVQGSHARKSSCLTFFVTLFNLSLFVSITNFAPLPAGDRI